MHLLWNEEDITNLVTVSGVWLHDNAGGMADNVDLLFPDPDQVWASWQPTKGDKIEVVESGFTSGVMYFDGWQFDGSTYKAMAISIPPEGKSSATRSWSNATLTRIATDIANAYGLGIATYGISDFTYDRVDQLGSGNIEFLHWLCSREGYLLKITDGKAVLIGEKSCEQSDPVKTINLSQMVGKPQFTSSSTGLKSSCIAKYLSHNGVLVEYKSIAPGVYGGEQRIEEHLASIGEAERFTKAALRAANKHEYTGCFKVQLDPQLAAAVCITIDGLGAMSGKWFVENVSHDINGGQTRCWIRKPIEGDY